MIVSKTLSLSLSLAGLLLFASSCTSIPSDQSIADYCAQSDKMSESICRLKVEIDGNSTAIAETDLSVEQARALADAAQASADEAAEAAAAAQLTADTALVRANQALEAGDLQCITKTVNNSKIGQCPENFALVSCTQTRFTERAGGLSFLREVDNEQCRFNSSVLEMDVRCCRAAGSSYEWNDTPKSVDPAMR